MRAGESDDVRFERESRINGFITLDAALIGAGLGAAIHAPLVNIDGTPMLGNVGLHGNPCGVVEMFSRDSLSIDSGAGMSDGLSNPFDSGMSMNSDPINH